MTEKKFVATLLVPNFTFKRSIWNFFTSFTLASISCSELAGTVFAKQQSFVSVVF